MNEFIAQHSEVIYSILLGVIMLLMFFIKEDRRTTKKKTEENAQRIKEIEQNYNVKFEKVYDKQDAIRTDMEKKHDELLSALHKIDLKVTKIV